MTASAVTGIVSRGGSIMATWCLSHHKESFRSSASLSTIQLDHEAYDIAYSLRPACAPAQRRRHDEAQFAELYTLGERTKRAWRTTSRS